MCFFCRAFYKIQDLIDNLYIMRTYIENNCAVTEYSDGLIEYRKIEPPHHLHREDGPAFINPNNFGNGALEWFIDGKRHREDGPAIEYYNGNKEWFLNDELHRVDGPAIECASGAKGWYYHGLYINCSSQEEFEKLLKLKAFW